MTMRKQVNYTSSVVDGRFIEKSGQKTNCVGGEQYTWSVNYFRCIMHSKSPVVNLAEPTNIFGGQMSSIMQQSLVTNI